ncbi:MAG: hypothetical protein QM594_01210 [Niabella sp.]
MLDSQNRWLVKHAMISNPYTGDGKPGPSTLQYATTMVGDETDTSPFMDISEEEYISMAAYIRNMRMPIGFMNASKEKNNEKSVTIAFCLCFAGSGFRTRPCTASYT